MMIKRLFLGSALVILSLLSYAQTIHGSLKGTVVEKATGTALQNVHVLLSPFDGGKGTVTDEFGVFHFEDLEVGHYDIAVRSLAHRDLLRTELWVRAGKQTVILVEMEPRVHVLENELEVVPRIQVERLGLRSFTVEQSLRYAATFSDPGRLASSFPGVASVNDQANHISVRGNSPNANRWMVEGMEIVSPNHLGNAGTKSDGPTLSGGGVSILSTQMLRRSSFHTGVFSSRYSNATGGLMDMRLRKGSVEKNEWTVQAGLIGIDIATEGPLSKKKRSSYLVNYRYSTLGLLSGIGVDLGDEIIKFQDLSFSFDLALTKRTQLKLFGCGGASSNNLEYISDRNLWENDRDSTAVEYNGVTAVFGAVFTQQFGENTSLELGSTLSLAHQDHHRFTTHPRYSGFSVVQWAYVDDEKWSSRLALKMEHGQKWTAEYGITRMYQLLSTHTFMGYSTPQGVLLRPYTRHNVRLSERLALELGVGYSMWDLNSDAVLEPMISISQQVSDKGRIALRVGRRSELPDYQLFATQGFSRDGSDVQHLELVQSTDLELGYSYVSNKGLQLSISGFYQELSNLPMYELRIDSILPAVYVELSSINLWNEVTNLPVKSVGTATIMGASISAERAFRDALFYSVNVSLFNSSYGTEEALDENSSRWDIGFTSNASIGTEFKKEKEGLIRTFGISARINVAGGRKYVPISEGNPEPEITKGYTKQYDPSYRIDLRIYWKKDREGKTGMWSIDILNATNAQNAAYDRYDQRQQKVLTEYQLGIIPNLSYRLEF